MRPTSVARWVRLRPPPVADEGSITKRSGQKLPALQAESNFWAPQEARSDNPEVVGSSPISATKESLILSSIGDFSFYYKTYQDLNLHIGEANYNRCRDDKAKRAPSSPISATNESFYNTRALQIIAIGCAGECLFCFAVYTKVIYVLNIDSYCDIIIAESYTKGGINYV